MSVKLTIINARFAFDNKILLLKISPSNNSRYIPYRYRSITKYPLNKPNYALSVCLSVCLAVWLPVRPSHSSSAMEYSQPAGFVYACPLAGLVVH